MGAFQFVPVGSAGQPKNANDRKTIRKAAMLAFRRRERIERVKAFAAECAAEAEAKAASSSAAPLGDSTTTQTMPGDFGQSGPIVLLKNPDFSVGNDVGSEKSPFADEEVLLPPGDHYRLINSHPPEIPRDLGYLNGLSFGDMPDVGYLFEYFVSEIIPIMLPFEGHNKRLLRIYWSRNLMKDRVILQAALSHAAVHMDTANRREPSKLAVTHTKYAIRLINQRLGTKPFTVDNDFIAAVAMIANNANLTGDLVESQIHMDALKELVRLKGGRDKLSPDKFLHALLSWSDTTSARIARSKPRFVSDVDISNDLTCSLAAVLPPLFHIDDIFGLIAELRKLTDLKKSLDSSNTSTIADIMAFDTQRNALEERVLCLQYTFSTTQDLGFGDMFVHACCIAASIYMSLAFRKFHSTLPNLRTSKHDLMATILKAETLYASLNDLPESNFPFAESLVWVLFIGGSLALDSSEATWFSNRLSLVVPWTEVRSWEDADACLKGVLWVDKLHNETSESLWNEVEDLLGFKDAGIVQPLEDSFDAHILGLPVSGFD